MLTRARITVLTPMEVSRRINASALLVARSTTRFQQRARRRSDRKPAPLQHLGSFADAGNMHVAQRKQGDAVRSQSAGP
jgi:hypothetical protein